MRTIALLMFLSLAACGEASNTFEVRVADSATTTAQLKLCCADLPLVKHESRFTGTQSASCEGEGEILVSFSDRPSVSCRIGYVTPGAAQAFRFVVKDGRCQLG